MANDSDDTRPDEAKRLQQAREAMNFKTAKDAATYFGWKYDSYIQHERGERGISKAAPKYAKAFRVSKAWLLTGELGRISPEEQEFLDLLQQAPEAERLAFLALLRSRYGRGATEVPQLSEPKKAAGPRSE